MNGLQYSMLRCIEKIGTDRTVYGTYHILKGKKSAQTIQDAKLYGLDQFFRLFPHLKREIFDSELEKLEQKHFIREQILTENGKKELEEVYFPQVNGYLYGEQSILFWKRLVLVIQTISHWQKGEKFFRPLVRELGVTTWVKYYLLNNPSSKQEFAEKIYRELDSYLRARTELEATIFVWRLTGYKRIGLTDKQIADKLGLDSWTVYYLFLSVLHGLLEEIEQYPFLQAMAPIVEKNKLSHSAKRTNDFYKQGFSIEEISQIRRLKQSTIEDHIVEIVLNNPNLPIEQFVTQQQQGEITQVYKQIQTRKLKTLKEQLHEEISYFQIRLVLTRVGGQTDEH